MSPHRINLIPSPSDLASYDISKNGFLPAETPLSRLPHHSYEPWERIIRELPILIEEKRIRQRVDELNVLETTHLTSGSEWRRAYSILTIIAQGYIWQGLDPSEVSYSISENVI